MATGALAVWLVPWGRFMDDLAVVPWVPPEGDVFAVAGGTWGWATSANPCGEDAHEIGFTPDHAVMTIVHRTPVGDSSGTAKREWLYDVLGSDSTRIRGAIRGEDRLTGDGVPVVWDLVLTGADEYRWHRTDWAEGQYTGPVRRCPAPGVLEALPDRGIGVVHLPGESGGGVRAPRESLLVRSRPAPDQAVTAVFLRVEDSTHAWRYALQSPDSLVPALLEFDYEIEGLPIDALSGDSSWARVLLGRDGGGGVRGGWVALDPAQAGVLLWREHLPERGWLFFADSNPPPVHREPDGPVLDAGALFAGDGSHSLYTEEVRGDWMKVRIVSPDDSCGQDAGDSRVTRGWIRYLDPRGRPRVWYYTRGC